MSALTVFYDLGAHLRLVATIFAALLISVIVVYITTRIIKWMGLTWRNLVVLELIPVSFNVNSTLPLTRFLESLHPILENRPWYYRVMRWPTVLPLETMVLPSGRLRHLLPVERRVLNEVLRVMKNAMPYIKVQACTDYLNESRDKCHIDVYGSTGGLLPFVLPGKLNSPGPADGLANIISGVKRGESLVLQIVMVPERFDSSKNNLKDTNTRGLLGKLAYIINESSFSLRDLIAETISAPSYNKARIAAGFRNQPKQPRQTQAMERDISRSLHTKMAGALFSVNIRVMLRSNDKMSLKKTSRLLRTTFESYGIHPRQSLKARRRLPFCSPCRRFALYHRAILWC